MCMYTLREKSLYSYNYQMGLYDMLFFNFFFIFKCMSLAYLYYIDIEGEDSFTYLMRYQRKMEDPIVFKLSQNEWPLNPT